MRLAKCLAALIFLFPSLSMAQTFPAESRNGSIPYRDFTAYMPPGGCSFPNNNFPYGYKGSIASGTATLSLAGGGFDFKNGCGITVEHAGPASTLVLPSCTVSTAARTANVVTITCVSNTNLVWAGTGGANGQDQGVSVTGCSDSSYNGVFVMQTNDATRHFTYNAAGANNTVIGCVVSFYQAIARGVTGSRTYYYKIASIDSGSGMSAAVGPITVTNGNASLSVAFPNQNYNTIFYPYVLGSKGTAIYRSLDNVNYTCVGVQMVALAYQDWGFTGPCPDFIPKAPPASPTKQALTTTIASGAGTTSLVLAAGASSTVTGQAVFHDEMPFLDACVNAVNRDQQNVYGYNQGSAGCYIPAGVYHFNSDWSTDRIAPSGGGIQIRVSGTLYMGEWPLTIGKSGYAVIGDGWSGGATNASNYATVATQRAAEQPGVFVIKNNAVLEGFATSFGNGNALTIGLPPDGLGAPAGISIRRMILGESASASGIPLYIGGNTFQLRFSDVNFGPRPDGFPASVLMTTDSFSGIGGADIYFDHVQFIWHHFFTNAPGGQNGQGFSFDVDTMWSEEHGQYPTGGFLTNDGSRTGFGLHRMQNADASNKTLLYIYGPLANVTGVGLDGTDPFNPVLVCDATSTTCGNGTAAPLISGSQTTLLGIVKNFNGTLGNGSTVLDNGLKIMSGYGDNNATPINPVFADTLPPPYQTKVTSTGEGSLAAGTYCIRIVGVDSQVQAVGQTLPGPEVCRTVGASSSIGLLFTLPQIFDGGAVYSGFQLWYGPRGGETNYIKIGVPGGTNSAQAYTFTSTAGALRGALPTLPNAYFSWLFREPFLSSCLYCVPSTANSALWQLGIGEPRVPNGDKLAVKGGVLDAESGFRSALSTKSRAYTLTTYDSWVNVIGSTTITVPHATTGNRWVVFNSGFGSVTVAADSGNINGGASITLSANTGKEIACDGTNCFAH